MSSALSDLTFYDAVKSPNDKGRLETILARTPMMGYPRFRMDYEAGIFFLGKQRFSRAHWAYPLLPKWMYRQGRTAKEIFSIYNNALWDCLEEGEIRFHVRRVCDECFGPIRMDEAGDYYCDACGLLIGEGVMLPGYDSIQQSTTMKDHNYNDPIL